jgi:hypothetical protein
MKTYSQFYQEISNNEPFRPFRECESLAAKEYAKQWIDEAADIAMLHAELGQPVGDPIFKLKDLIDKQ